MSAFSVFTDRKKKQKNTQTPTVEQYYRARAGRLTQLRYACLLLTVLFLVYGFAAHGEELTLDQFRYMLKFVDLTENDSPGSSSEIRYDFSDDNRGTLYRGDVAVLNNEGLSIYGWDADRLFHEAFRMDDPRMVATRQNLFVYDLGGNELRVFNSLSQLARFPMEYPIYGFAACDAGSFAVITSEKNYRNTVLVYDEHMRQIYKRSFSDTYVDQISLSPDGSAFLALGHKAQNGDLLTVLQAFSVRQEEPLFTATYAEELPLCVSYLSDERFAVLTGNALRCYPAGKAEPDAVLPLSERTLNGCSFADGSILLTFSTQVLSGGTVLKVYNAFAEQTFEAHYDGDILDKTLYGNSACVLIVGELFVTPMNGGEAQRYEVGKDALSALPDAYGNLILFEKSKAYHLIKASS